MPMEDIDANLIKMNGMKLNVKLIIVILDFIIINMNKNVWKNVVSMIPKVI